MLQTIWCYVSPLLYGGGVMIGITLGVGLAMFLGMIFLHWAFQKLYDAWEWVDEKLISMAIRKIRWPALLYKSRASRVVIWLMAWWFPALLVMLLLVVMYLAGVEMLKDSPSSCWYKPK